jgi:uncharacterized integral membrane protein
LYRVFFIIVVILAVALGLLVGTLNSDLVKVDLLWVQLEWPLGLLILSASVFGLFLGLVLAWLLSILPLRSQLRKARARESQAASGALNNLDD